MEINYIAPTQSHENVVQLSSGRIVAKQEVTQFWDYFRLVGDIGS